MIQILKQKPSISAPIQKLNSFQAKKNNNLGDNIRCEYCNENKPDHLFKCSEKDCGRWFCNNGIIKESGSSHIVAHLNYLSHKSIELHPKNNTLPIKAIKCHQCNSRYIFSLGCLKENQKIICRVPCLSNSSVDVNSWRALVIEKQLVLDFSYQLNVNDEKFKYRSKSSLPKCNKINLKKLISIESKYKVMPVLSDDDEFGENPTQKRIKKKYKDIEEYRNTFVSLLAHDKISEVSNHFKTKLVEVNFYFANDRKSGYIYGYELGSKFNPKNEILFEKDGWDGKGKLFKIEGSKHFFTFKFAVPRYFESPSKLTMTTQINMSMNNRLNQGLQNLSRESVDSDLIDVLLGAKSEVFLPHFYNENDYSIPNSNRKLNISQNAAIRNALKYKISIIQGPPGTGKTETIATLVHNIIYLKGNSIDEMLKRRNLNKMIVSNIRERRAKAETAQNIAEVSVYECVDAEKNRFPLVKKTNKIIKNFEKSIDDEIQEKEKQIQQKTEGINNSTIDYLISNSSSDCKHPQKFQKINKKLKNFHQKIQEKCKLQAKIKAAENLKNKLAAHRSERLQNAKKFYKPLEQPFIPNFIQDLISGSNLTELNLCYNSQKKILVCASSNTAVKLLCDKLSKIGPKVIHIYARCKESENKDDELSLHFQLKQKLRHNKVYQALKKYFKSETQKQMKKRYINLQEGNKDLQISDSSSEVDFEDNEENYEYDVGEDRNMGNFLELIGKTSYDEKNLDHELKSKLNDIKIAESVKILQEADIICCTCITTSLNCMKNIEFQQVIIDEATQSLEPETVQCLLKGVNHVVLVGDIMQLGGVVKSSAASNLGLDIPLIERLMDNGVPHTFLNVQYRMHPMIAEFSNTYFYKGQIQNGVDIANRTYENFEFPDPVRNKPTFFYHIESSEEYSGNGGSYLNRFEADTIKRLIFYMMSQNVPAEHIAIITFYDGQRGFLVANLENSSPQEYEYLKKIEILSVDASQGREKEFIILSCVRANKSDGVGFLQEYRRLNVAMTRAMYRLIVCGNCWTLLNDPLWQTLLMFFIDRKLIFEGDIEELKSLDFDVGIPDFQIKSKKKYEEDLNQ